MKKFNFLGNLLQREFAMSGMSGMNGLRADAVNPDSQPTFNRQSRLTSQQRHNSVSGARVAREWLKYAAMFVMLLTIGVGNAWGTNASHTCSGTSGTIVTSKITWAATSATWNSPQCRIAANGTVVFTLTGVNVTSIVMGFSSSSYVGTWSSSGGGSFSTSSSNVTWTGTAGAGTLTFTTTAAARLKTIKVTYTDAASYTITAQSNNTSYGTVSLSGSVITGSPKAGYTYGSPAYSVSPANSATVSQAGNAFTVTPSANTTVTINFVARTAASITFVNAGTPAPTTSGYYVGDSYTLPSTNNYSCNGKTFVGWSTVEVEPTDTKPTSNFYEPGASATLGASQTFYAVFASVTEGTGDWEQCTSSTIADGDYLIVQSNKLMTNTLNSQRFNLTSTSISDGVISYDSQVSWGAYTWHIEETGTSGIFTIKNGDDYVIGTGTASKIDLVSTPEDDKELFAITYQSTPGTYKIESKYNEDQEVNRWVRNAGSYFACYADGAYPYLFKRGSGSGNYSTDCSTVSVTGVTVDPTSKGIVPGETFTITATVSPDNATDKSVTWSSGTPATATVSEGTVTGVAAGTSNITCTTTDGGKTATASVTVYAVEMQARDEDNDAIAAGGPGAPSRTGTEITAAADAGNYVFKEWDVVNASVAESGTTPTTISNPTGAVTVTAKYYKPRVIVWKVNNEEYTPASSGGTNGSSSVAYNTAWSDLTLPTDPDVGDYCGQKFVGWTTTDLEEAALNKDVPADATRIEGLNLMTSDNQSGKSTKITAETTTFHAVFADYTTE